MEEDLEEVDEGVLVDTAGSVGIPRRKQSERKVARSALQEVDEAEEGEGGGIDSLPRTGGNKAAVLMFDPDDDIDDV